MITSAALGIDPRVQGDYELLSGRDPIAPDAIVANDDFIRVTGARIGDTLAVSTGYDPQTRAFSGSRRLVLTGRVRFLYGAANQLATAMQLATLQELGGPSRKDDASLFMIRVRDGTNVEHARRWIEGSLNQVSVISTETALAQVDQRLSYFRQLALILGAVSLFVGFLLVTTLVTVSVNERTGEIAVMRAIGIVAGARRSADRARGCRDQHRRGGGRTLSRARDGQISERNSLVISGTSRGDRFLPLSAEVGVDGVGSSGTFRNRRRSLSVVPRSVAPDRHDVATGSDRVTDSVVQARDLTRDYSFGNERIHALRGVTFDITDGDYAAIVGPSGCGKSTLLNLLGAIDHPTSGSVIIRGTDVAQMQDSEATSVSASQHRLCVSALLSDADAFGARKHRAADGGSRNHEVRSHGTSERAARVRLSRSP